jgi:hypothetical protein
MPSPQGRGLSLSLPTARNLSATPLLPTSHLPTPYLPICLPAHLPICLPAHLPICPPAHLPICPPAYLPTCLPAHPPTCPLFNDSCQRLDEQWAVVQRL